MDFCYLVRRNAISSPDIFQIQKALDDFHHHRRIFIDTGVRLDISLPRQHALLHYIRAIQLFGAPNGLCSSITESMHIRAVKRPWRRSSRYRALVQMLRIITRMDKFAALRRILNRRGMLAGTTAVYMASHADSDEGEADEEDDESFQDDNTTERDLSPSSAPMSETSIRLASRAR